MSNLPAVKSVNQDVDKRKPAVALGAVDVAVKAVGVGGDVGRKGGRKSNNAAGHNRWTNADIDQPYSLRMARARLYLDMGMSYDQVQVRTGLCTETIARIKKKELEIDSSIVETLKKIEGNKLTILTHQILDSIDDKSIKKASLLQRVVSSATLIDKRELLEGRSTSRVSFDFSDPDLDAQIAKAQGELEAWRSGRLVNGQAEPITSNAS